MENGQIIPKLPLEKMIFKNVFSTVNGNIVWKRMKCLGLFTISQKHVKNIVAKMKNSVLYTKQVLVSTESKSIK